MSEARKRQDTEERPVVLEASPALIRGEQQVEARTHRWEIGPFPRARDSGTDGPGRLDGRSLPGPFSYRHPLRLTARTRHDPAEPGDQTLVSSPLLPGRTPINAEMAPKPTTEKNDGEFEQKGDCHIRFVSSVPQKLLATYRRRVLNPNRSLGVGMSSSRDRSSEAIKKTRGILFKVPLSRTSNETTRPYTDHTHFVKKKSPRKPSERRFYLTRFDRTKAEEAKTRKGFISTSPSPSRRAHPIRGVSW